MPPILCVQLIARTCAGVCVFLTLANRSVALHTNVPLQQPHPCKLHKHISASTQSLPVDIFYILIFKWPYLSRSNYKKRAKCKNTLVICSKKNDLFNHAAETFIGQQYTERTKKITSINTIVLTVSECSLDTVLLYEV